MPFILWTSFEMYVLTLFGPQMLFYSITHAYPAIYLTVLFSLPFVAVSFLFAVVTLIKGKSINIHYKTSYKLAAFIIFHAIALALYNQWSLITPLRVLVSVLGLLLVGYLIIYPLLNYIAPNTPLNSDQKPVD